MPRDLVLALVDAAAAAVAANADELTRLDQAIGDGDHGTNLRRGFQAIAAQREALAGLELGDALQKAGMTLVTTVGGASGPLYGSLLMGIGKALKAGRSATEAFTEGVESVKRRGKSDAGAKTMLDVLVPALGALREHGEAALGELRRAASEGREATKPMRATRGRASFLGERSVGHHDPGATSSCVLIHTVCDVLEGPGMTVGIVVVSHSPKVAEGAVDMVRQMVGEEVPCAWAGGDPAGGLGTDATLIKDAIERVWSEAGVAVFVDLGGAEMNAEMAIEMLDPERAGRVRICNAPVVEGAVVGATEASGGAQLEAVCAAAEELGG